MGNSWQEQRAQGTVLRGAGGGFAWARGWQGTSGDIQLGMKARQEEAEKVQEPLGRGTAATVGAGNPAGSPCPQKGAQRRTRGGCLRVLLPGPRPQSACRSPWGENTAGKPLHLPPGNHHQGYSPLPTAAPPPPPSPLRCKSPTPWD